MFSLLDMTELQSAVVLSLSSERRSGSQKGYWADALDGGNFGSHLWLLRRERLSNETLENAEHYAREALEWLVAQGFANTIDIKAERRSDTMKLNITIDGGMSVDYRL